MRTRKQVRNFGEDITNYQSIPTLQPFISHNSIKIETSQLHNNPLQDIKITKTKIKKISEDTHIEERIEQIMIFGYRYFEDIIGQTSYLSLPQTNQNQEQLPKNSINHIFTNSPQLTNSMRNVLVEWIVEVHHKMGLRYETLYMTIFLVDKFCSKRMVNKSQYQLLAMASLFLAGKYEEVSTPKLKKIMTLCDKMYNSTDILNMQSQILLEFNFKISQPSLNWFIGIQLFSVSINQKEDNKIKTENLQKFKRICYYITQLCLFQVQILSKFSPQVISNTIMYTLCLRSQFIGIDIRKNTKNLNPIQLRQIRDCAPKIRHVFSDRLNRKYDSVNIKYQDLLLADSTTFQINA